MSRIAMLYIGCEGQTRKNMERISYCLNQTGHDTVLRSLADLTSHFNLDDFDGAVLGSSIRYVKHHQACYEFIEKHSAQLAEKPGYFFSVNLTARKPERRDPFNNRYLQKLLRQIPWAPDRMDVFAGALLYTRYNWFGQQMIRLIMKITGGPTDPSQNIEFTDWSRVKTFAEQLERDFNRTETLIESSLHAHGETVSVAHVC